MIKTAQQIEDRIDSLYDSALRLHDLLNSSEDMEEGLEIEMDIAIVESKINSLKWVLNRA